MSNGAAPARPRPAWLSQAIAQGNHIAGFSFHVGSQLDSVGAFAAATAATLDLMDRLERQWDVRFTILDIGGGFPVGYRTDVASIEQISAAIRPLLEPRSSRLRILAEPGRILVAEAVTAVSRVIGVREREGEYWCFIDDGVHGSYSNVMTERVHPVIVARSELESGSIPLRLTTVTATTFTGRRPAKVIVHESAAVPNDGDTALLSSTH